MAGLVETIRIVSNETMAKPSFMLAITFSKRSRCSSICRRAVMSRNTYNCPYPGTLVVNRSMSRPSQRTTL